MERIRRRMGELRTRLAAILQAREATTSRHLTLTQQAEADFKKACEQLSQERREKLESLRAETARKREGIDAHWNRHATKVKTGSANIRAQLDKQARERGSAWNQRRLDARAQAIREHEQKLAAFQEQYAQALARLDDLGIASKELRERIANFAREYGVRLDMSRSDALPGAPLPTLPPEGGGETTTGETPDALQKRLTAIEQGLDAARLALRHRIPPLVVYAGVLAVHAAVYLGWGYKLYQQQSPYVLAIPVSFALLCALVYAAFSTAKNKVYPAAMGLCRDVNGVCGAIARQRVAEHDRNIQGLANMGCDRVVREHDAEEEVQRLMVESNRPITAAITRLEARRDRLLERIARDRKADLQRAEREAAEKAESQRARYETTLTQRRETYGARKREADDEKTRSLERLAASWQAELSQFNAFVEEVTRQSRQNCPPWPELSARDWRLPDTFHREVPVGTLHLDLKALAPECDPEGPFSIPSAVLPSPLLGEGQGERGRAPDGSAPLPTLSPEGRGETTAEKTLPLLLSFPLEGSLFIRAGVNKRDEAMRALSGAVLRLLCSFPPAKAKLTIIDPIGLGQNLAGLMHLADYDESLVGGRIWSDVAHIERKLTELTEHMEKVIQKYLRNRYSSIDDYNREAGQMAEPYRFLVIADFPAGFSELALERLASIIKSGVRCGVYTLILLDERRKLPPLVDIPQLRRNGLVIAHRGTGFIVDDESLCRERVECEEAPLAALVDGLVNAIGRQCRDASRVQVPFDAVTPKPDQYWQLSTEQTVRVPLGKSGADRLQYLELGRGTAQHAIIAGKTGSGKSNLFHVIVTSAASWYSPHELEFYLVDFKKGVEFKTYGVHRLRHARVVAIESDREFALSVLRRVDRELIHRGELFRKARVQDFPSYRKACPETPLPRTLLLIDEFQEFFTDDDQVAQDAALLLDRIVRQGRAFGIHAVLGSQTLGGTYTLAKSTLGQVGVRIALQCNEADSYLILADDNAAASLLSRPGEAIYNDMSGLVEGNNPFQAVWLPKEEQDAHLSGLQRRAVEVGVESVEPTVVFEGNTLSDLRNNPLLRSAALREPQPVDSAVRIWLGEPNAIKGPTDVEFTRQAGSNLLVVGPRGDMELSMCCSTLLSLAAGYAPGSMAIRVLDGTRPDSPARERLTHLTAALPHDIEIADYRRAPQLIQELTATMKDRQEEGAEVTSRIFLLVLGLEKFRMLRQDDEFSFAAPADESASNAGKGFVDLLTGGPNAGIHALVWCDTLGNLNRSLSRKTLHEFEMRVLFQMSASDSSELIDTPAANRLGMYSALLFSAQSGVTEKFRPYATPDRELIEDFGRILKARAVRVRDK